MIAEQLVAGKNGPLLAQESAALDPRTGKLLGAWRESYLQARSGYGNQPEDQGTQVLATCSGRRAWGVAQRGSEFLLVGLAAGPGGARIGGRDSLSLGVGTYAGKSAPGRTSIGTLTPRVLIRCVGGTVILSIEQALRLVDASGEPRLRASYDWGNAAAITGLDAAE